MRNAMAKRIGEKGLLIVALGMAMVFVTEAQAQVTPGYNNKIPESIMARTR